MKLNHLAIIMDGNRRWARSNNMPSYESPKGCRKFMGYNNLRSKIKVKISYRICFFTEN